MKKVQSSLKGCVFVRGTEKNLESVESAEKSTGSQSLKPTQKKKTEGGKNRNAIVKMIASQFQHLVNSLARCQCVSNSAVPKMLPSLRKYAFRK